MQPNGPREGFAGITSEVSIQGGEVAAPILKLIQGGRDKGKIPFEIRKSIHNRICLHGHNLRAVSRAAGMSDNETVQVLIAEIYAERDQRIKSAWQMGYRAGYVQRNGAAIFVERRGAGAAA